MSQPVTEDEFRLFASALHKWRGELAKLKADLAAHQLQFEAENAALLSAIADASISVTTTEAALRQLTLATYHKTGDKKPWSGVGIWVNSILHYEGDVALAWAKEHGLALMLDVKAFVAIANVQPLEFVRIEDEARATIAQDLGTFLEIPDGS